MKQVATRSKVSRRGKQRAEDRAPDSPVRLPGKLVHWPIDKLRPYERNPRTHSPEQITKIAASLLEFGWTNPILVDGDAGVIAGHGRLLAARELGMTTVPVIELSHLTEAQRRALLIADNRLALDAGWDEDLLAEELKALEGLDFNLSLIGFDLDELHDLLDDEAAEEVPAPEPPANPVARRGDLWTLGDHRLVCGDALCEGDVARLMGGEQAAMVFTDPPYNVDYGASKNPRHRIRQIENDNQDRAGWDRFCRSLAKTMARYCRGDVYVWGASGPDGMRQRLAFIDEGFHWSATIIWKKQQLVLSPAKYQRMYEPCFYGWAGTSSFVADRTQVEVWEVDRPTASDLHPTMKPIALCTIGIRNSSVPRGIVLDLFGGSGSTMIASEQTGRRCFMMELDPAYTDVIVLRWQEATGQKALLDGDGRAFEDVSAERKPAGDE